MGFKGVIFDLDGTLLDSMGIWSNLCYEFLLKYNIDPGKESLAAMYKKLEVLSIRNALREVLKIYPQIDIDLETAHAQTWQIVEDFYCRRAEIKPGIPEILAALEQKNIPSGIITATEAELVAKALERTGLAGRFSGGVMSCAALQTSKRTPEVFFMMAEKLGSSPAETIVFEDALYAADTAKRAGFAVAAVYDPSEKNQDALRETADWYCRSWKDLPLEIL